MRPNPEGSIALGCPVETMKQTTKIEDMQLQKLNLSKKKLAQISLSQSCKAIILGSLLGDGCLKIYKPYKNARFWIRHSWCQKEYWEWKISQLTEIQTFHSHQIQEPNGYSKKKKLLFQSAAQQQLTEIYSLTYKRNRLQIKRSWLNHLTPLSLAICWLDDGSIIGKGKRGVLCTDNLSKKENIILQRYLQVQWKIHVKIGTLNRKFKVVNRLYFNTTSLKQFFRIIMSSTPIPSMIYKYCLLYKDTKLQERWISEMVIAFSNSQIEEKEIRGIISARKMQLKYFRK